MRKRPPSLRILRREFLATAAALGSITWLDACAGSHVGSTIPFDRSLTQEERAALRLAVQVMLPDPLPSDGATIDEIIDNLQRFLQHADATTFADVRHQLSTLGSLAPLANHHIPSLRRLAAKHLNARGYSELRNTLDSLHKVVVLGYYAHPKTYRALGYESLVNQPRHNTLLPVRARPGDEIFDVAIVGSGVAGSLLAGRLSAAGKRVVILEAGPYVPEASLTDDELLWIARLQRGSGLQLANAVEPYVSAARSFPVLQGHCVGGGGVINNAVCFQMPAARLTQWQALGFPVSERALRDAYSFVGRELGMCSVLDAVGGKPERLDPALTYLSQFFGAPSIPAIDTLPAPGFYECLVNLERGQCIGCGRCNTGCGSEAKRNALQVHLPAALDPTRSTQLIADANVEEIVLAGTGRVGALRVRSTRSGVEPFEVRAKEYVLAAGAIHTPALLLRSPGVRAQASGLPIGDRVSMNLVSPVFGFMQDDVQVRASLQLTHYYIPPDPEAGFMIENLYDPPGQAALVMSGYGDEHFVRMQRYKRTLLAGAVVPTLPNGSVRVDRNGRNVITQPLGADELSRMRNGLALTARAMLQGGAYGEPYEVVVGSESGGFRLAAERDVPALERWLTSFSQIALSTGHPQGGCAMSTERALGVVDSDFRVRGFDNLRVCDASLFPMAVGVNPQWTVMALAHHCGNVMKASNNKMGEKV